MSAEAWMKLICNGCRKPFMAKASRAWKARITAAAKGWTKRPKIGPRGGQDTLDFCPDCSALLNAEAALREPAAS